MVAYQDGNRGQGEKQKKEDDEAAAACVG